MAWPKGVPRKPRAARDESVEPDPELTELGSTEQSEMFPDDIPRDAGEPPARKKRGRGRPASKSASLDPDGITTLLLSIHLGLASVTGQPAFALEQSEARKLAEAGVEVAKHYDIAVLSPRTMAWINFGLIAAGIYGPRVMAMRLMSRKPTEMMV